MSVVEQGVNWTCPYCSRPQVILSGRIHKNNERIWNDASEFGATAIWYQAIACANDACRKMVLAVALCERKDQDHGGRYRVGDVIQQWNLLPESSAKPQPDYIPEPLREDYIEACRIRDLSPKASATLARRCLQGMIRDFCKITDATLDKEIKKLDELVRQDKAPRGVTPESVQAIDDVRKVGNIGAHMEKDINLIVPIDPDEAQILIELVETLFDEWYVGRAEREERFKRLTALRAEKDAARKPVT